MVYTQSISRILKEDRRATPPKLERRRAIVPVQGSSLKRKIVIARRDFSPDEAIHEHRVRRVAMALFLSLFEVTALDFQLLFHCALQPFQRCVHGLLRSRWSLAMTIFLSFSSFTSERVRAIEEKAGQEVAA